MNEIVSIKLTLDEVYLRVFFKDGLSAMVVKEFEEYVSIDSRYHLNKDDYKIFLDNIKKLSKEDFNTLNPYDIVNLDSFQINNLINKQL